MMQSLERIVWINLKISVGQSKIPFALSESKGGRGIGLLTPERDGVCTPSLTFGVVHSQLKRDERGKCPVQRRITSRIS
jgi:hypothetical protein